MISRTRSARRSTRGGHHVVLGAAAALLLTLTACGGSDGAASPSSPTTSSPTTSSPTTSSPTTSSSAPTSTSPTPTRTARSPAQIRAEVTSRLAAITRTLPEHSVSIAAVNRATGARYVSGAKRGMWTASCYKLFILETLLLQRQHDGGLSGGEVSQATTMIENSDNVAGYSLFLDIGGNSGLEGAEQRLGMTHTVPGQSDPTFTRTSATDYVSLLQNLVAPGPLDADSRSFVLHLMRNVESDQRWGVGVLADRGTSFANKNGWLSIDDSNGPGERDDGRWAVNSVGVLRVGGQQVLVSIFTQHNPSFGDGIQLVQRLARTIRPAVAH